MITDKLNEKPWILWRLWNAFVNNGLSMGGAVTDDAVGAAMFEDILYADLVTAHGNDVLVPGKKYRITDYKTVFTLNISGDPYTSATVEPLIVTAATNNSLEPTAFSVAHPNDIIYYSLDGTTYMPGSTKGCITRRIDTEKNISVPFDFREFKVEVANVTTPNEYDNGVTYAKGDIMFSGSNIKISLQNSNTGNDGDAAFWRTILDKDNDKTVSGFTFFNGTIGNGGTIEGPFELFGVSNSSNFVINNQPENISGTLFKTYGYVTNCTFDVLSNCVFKSEDALSNNRCGSIKDCIFNGAVVDNNLVDVNGLITGLFNNNTISNGFNNNFIASASGNTIAANAQNNIAGVVFQDNTIGLRFQNNTIGNNFGNVSMLQKYGNQIGNDFHDNVIGNNASDNVIGNWFYQNVAADEFQSNNLPFKFYGNTLPAEFQTWNAQCVLYSKDFTGLTLPNPETSKYLIWDLTDELSWGYWDNGAFVLTAF